MPSAQVVMAQSPTESRSRETRPSALGHFLSKFGPKRDRSKSPVASSKMKTTNIPPRGSPIVTPLEDDKKPMVLEEGNACGGSPSCPPVKPKRHSSPFARAIHRFSINRSSNKTSRDKSSPRIDNFSQSRETVYSTACPSDLAVTSVATAPPRPAVSEIDLRNVTITRGIGSESPVQPLSGANTFFSEDNLDRCVRSPPSYLRVSCAVNGYAAYRVPRLNITPSRTPTRAVLPMSNVERLRLEYNNVLKTPLEPTRRLLKEEMGALLNTPSPIRDLVARFDKLHIEAPRDDFGNIQPAPKVIKMQADNENNALFNQSKEQNSARIISNESNSKPISATNGSMTMKNNGNGAIITEPRTGQDFAILMSETRGRLQKSVAKAVHFLESKELNLPEGSGDTLRMAAGKANLLLSKKLKRFAELVDKNLNPTEGDSQTVTVNDLAGYWELVNTELIGIDQLFDEVNELEANGWQLPITSETAHVKTSNKLTNGHMALESSDGSRAPKKRSIPVKVTTDIAKKAADDKRRREALAEAKRKQKEKMMEQMTAGDASNLI